MDGAGKRVVAIVLGAGQGTRMGAGRNKVLLALQGKPLLVHSLETFERTPEVDDILLVAHPLEITFCQEEILDRYDLHKASAVIPGGATRHQSEDRALATLRSRIEAGEVRVILIHDGARPLITVEDTQRVLRAAIALGGPGGALLASHLDQREVILQRGDDNVITDVYDPQKLARAQTPQAFEARSLLAAYDRARVDGFEGTDTAASIERMGFPTLLVEGASTNMKVTTPDDLVRAEEFFRLRLT